MTEVKQQEEASKNVSFFFGVRSCGFLLTAYLSGELLEHIDKHTSNFDLYSNFLKNSVFLITSFFPLGLVFISQYL